MPIAVRVVSDRRFDGLGRRGQEEIRERAAGRHAGAATTRREQPRDADALKGNGTATEVRRIATMATATTAHDARA